MDIRTEFSDLLTQIEDEMRSVLDERRGSARPLYEMIAYHLGLDRPDGPRGKRIRPLLGLLAYQALAGEPRVALPGAAAAELGHNFSLVHDDIEDADRQRHHRPTLWAIWGVPLAINAGDALFVLSRLALHRLRETGRFPDSTLLDLMHVFDETCLALCEGQYLDLSFERRNDVTVEEYLDMIAKKTAALIGSSVQMGAMLAGRDAETVEAARRFGDNLGIAFQIADDVKGTFWASEASGKAEAGDVRKRKKTLPVIWAMEHADTADAERLRQIYAAPMEGSWPGGVVVAGAPPGAGAGAGAGADGRGAEARGAVAGVEAPGAEAQGAEARAGAGAAADGRGAETRGAEARSADALERPLTADEVDEVLAILERCGAQDAALSEARRYRDAALEIVQRLPIPEDRRGELSRFVGSMIAA